MRWDDVEQLAVGGFAGIQWVSRCDGIWEQKSKDCAIFKIYHRKNTGTMRFEFGIIGCDKVPAVKDYLERHGISGKITKRGNAVATVNKTRFRIGIGETPYLVFKPMEPVSLRLEDLDKTELTQEFQKFRDSVVSSGLDALLAGIL